MRTCAAVTREPRHDATNVARPSLSTGTFQPQNEPARKWARSPVAAVTPLDGWRSPLARYSPVRRE